MKNTLCCLIFALLILISLSACGGSPAVHQPAPSIPPTPEFEVGIVEIGHMVYIPLNLSGSVESNIESIMVAVQTWEHDNPGRQVLDVDPVFDQSAYATSAYTYGVTIYFTEK